MSILDEYEYDDFEDEKKPTLKKKKTTRAPKKEKEKQRSIGDLRNSSILKKKQSIT
jgi:hypothetical protein